MSLQIVARGTWLYDDEVEQPVDIVALDYDWWRLLAEADGLVEDAAEPSVPSPDGYLYYARFRRAGDKEEPTWVDTDGHPTVDGAMRAAEEKLGRKIKWER